MLVCYLAKRVHVDAESNHPKHGVVLSLWGFSEAGSAYIRSAPADVMTMMMMVIFLSFLLLVGAAGERHLP